MKYHIYCRSKDGFRVNYSSTAVSYDEARARLDLCRKAMPDACGWLAEWTGQLRESFGSGCPSPLVAGQDRAPEIEELDTPPAAEGKTNLVTMLIVGGVVLGGIWLLTK